MSLFYILSFKQHCKQGIYVKYLISEYMISLSCTSINLIVGKYQHFLKHMLMYEQGK